MVIEGFWHSGNRVLARFICKTLKMFEFVAKINATALCRALFCVIIFISISAPFHRIWYIVLTCYGCKFISEIDHWYYQLIFAWNKNCVWTQIIINCLWKCHFCLFPAMSRLYLLVTIFDSLGKNILDWTLIITLILTSLNGKWDKRV